MKPAVVVALHIPSCGGKKGAAILPKTFSKHNVRVIIKVQTDGC